MSFSPLLRYASCAFVLGAVLAAPAAAQEAERGVSLGLTYTLDALALARGGLDRGVSTLHKLDVSAEWRSGGDGVQTVIYADVQATAGGAFSGRRVGDVQVVSNLEAPDALRLFELWVSREGPDGGVRAGLIDLNRDIDVQSTGALFLNSSHGVGVDLSQSGEGGPSIFPSTGLGVTAHAVFGPWTLRAAAFEGLPRDGDEDGGGFVDLDDGEGVLLLGEAEREFAPGWRARIGAWRYTERRDVLAPRPGDAPRATDRGAYVYVEGRLAGADGSPGLDAWLRAGVADDRVNLVEAYLGGGLARRGVWRDDDVAGIAIAHAVFGGAAERALGYDPAPETAIELTYRTRVSGVLEAQPNLQYLISPGGRTDVRSALVAGVRLVVSLDAGPF